MNKILIIKDLRQHTMYAWTMPHHIITIPMVKLLILGLCTVRIMPWVFPRLWIFVPNNLIVISFLVRTSFCFIRCFFLSCQIKLQTFSLRSNLTINRIQIFYRSSLRIAVPDILFHLSPRTFPTSVNAIPGLLFLTFYKTKQERNKSCHVWKT